MPWASRRTSARFMPSIFDQGFGTIEIKMEIVTEESDLDRSEEMGTWAQWDKFTASENEQGKFS